MGEHKRYPIEKMGDFLAVPPEKLEHCLKDFCDAVRLGHAAATLMRAIGQDLGVENIAWELNHGVWIDDGKHDITVKVASEVVSRDG